MWILFTTARTARLWDLNLIISWLFVQHSAWWGSGKGNINPYFSLALSPVLSAVALSTSITLIFAITLPHIEKNPDSSPKNPNTVIIYSPSSCSKVDGSHWLPLYGKKILWNSMGTKNCLVTHILHNMFFCVQQKKEIHTGLEQLDGE